MKIHLKSATLDDAPALAMLRTSVAVRLTREFGTGPWSSDVSDSAQTRAIQSRGVLVARHGPQVVATLRLAPKKPWAIAVTHFTQVPKPLYLTDMAVAPDFQRRGIGRECMAEAARVAREWPANAIRLDAYDALAGAGPFYAKCGLREVGRVTYRRTPLIYYELVL